MASFHARLCASCTPVLPPKPPLGGIDVGGIAGQKHAAVAESLGHVRLGIPGHHVLDRDRDSSTAERDACTSSRPRSSVRPVGNIGDRVRRIAERVDGQKAAVERLLEPEEPAQRRVDHVDHAEIAAAQQRP